MITIYRITHAETGRSYVGQTRNQLAIRWSQHKHGARSGNRGLLATAIREHGAESFAVTVLQVCESVPEANDAEVRWIAEIGSQFPAGFNKQVGGGSPDYAALDPSSKPVSFRIKASITQQADGLIPTVSRQYGRRVSRAEVLQEAVARGLATIRRELAAMASPGGPE